MLESIVTRYNGIPIPIDAFEGKKKVIENQIKDLDIVILVTAFAAHDSTWNIREFASKYGAKVINLLKEHFIEQKMDSQHMKEINRLTIKLNKLL